MSPAARGSMESPIFFATPAEFRRWLERHHETAKDLWVGFHKRATGKPSLTWPQSVDEALCVGWIDGLRKSLGADAYAIRFSPRRSGSIWSAINLRRVPELEAEGRMKAAGLAAFRARDPKRANVYSFENQPATLAPAFARRLRASRPGAAFFAAQVPSYQRTCIHWVMSAKQETTRERRFAMLLESCERGIPVPPLKWLKLKAVGDASGKKSAAKSVAAKKRVTASGARAPRPSRPKRAKRTRRG